MTHVDLTPADLQALDSALDQALRVRGIHLVEPVADLIRSVRVQVGHGPITFSDEMIGTLVQACDAACRGGGLGMAEVAVALLSKVRDAHLSTLPPPPPLSELDPDDTAVEPIGGV